MTHFKFTFIFPEVKYPFNYGLLGLLMFDNPKKEQRLFVIFNTMLLHALQEQQKDDVLQFEFFLHSSNTTAIF